MRAVAGKFLSPALVHREQGYFTTFSTDVLMIALTFGIFLEAFEMSGWA